jgi:transposase
MTVLAEAGYDMSPWPTADHFVAWLRLAPDNRISGDKVIGKGRTPAQNRLTQSLKMAASSLKANQTYLGAQYRRLRARRGPAVAVEAMAARLARLVYNMLCTEWNTWIAELNSTNSKLEKVLFLTKIDTLWRN